MIATTDGRKQSTIGILSEKNEENKVKNLILLPYMSQFYGITGRYQYFARYKQIPSPSIWAPRAAVAFAGSTL